MGTLKKRQRKKQAAVRYDADKLRVDLIPVRPIFDIAAVNNFGSKKYADRNWEKGMDWSRCYGSALRHLLKWWMGEDKDKESGLPHLAHAAWNILALQEYTYTHRELDDRPE